MQRSRFKIMIFTILVLVSLTVSGVVLYNFGGKEDKGGAASAARQSKARSDAGRDKNAKDSKAGSSKAKIPPLQKAFEMPAFVENASRLPLYADDERPEGKKKRIGDYATRLHAERFEKMLNSIPFDHQRGYGDNLKQTEPGQTAETEQMREFLLQMQQQYDKNERFSKGINPDLPSAPKIQRVIELVRALQQKENVEFGPEERELIRKYMEQVEAEGTQQRTPTDQNP